MRVQCTDMCTKASRDDISNPTKLFSKEIMAHAAHDPAVSHAAAGGVPLELLIKYYGILFIYLCKSIPHPPKSGKQESPSWLFNHRRTGSYKA